MFLEKKRFTTSPPATFAEFILNDKKCKGCGRCVATCPTQVLELNNKKSRPNNRYSEHRCITCQSCIAVCPKGAITIKGDYRVSHGFFKNVDIFTGHKTMPQPIVKYKNKEYKDYEKELTETERVIYNRRSVRLYKKKPVPRDLIRRVIEAGRFAPSAGNNQPWKFIVIDNREIIDELDRSCKKFLRLSTYLTIPHEERDKKIPGSGNKSNNKAPRLSLLQKILVPPLVRKNPGRLEPRVIKAGLNAPASDPDYDIFLGAPVLILLLADWRGIGTIDLDVGMCGQNMTLAAHSLGLGVCYIGLIDAVNFSSKLKKQLGIAPPFKLITSMILGYPKGVVDRPVAREPARIDWIDEI